ncbi:hypothetical protein JCM3774_004105 [Rhodotorula dairenensis]
MAATLEHPLSGRNKGWTVPDFSLEARRPKAVATLPVGQFHLGPPAAPLAHPDEEKGRSLRTNTRSASTSGLFASADSVNRNWSNGSSTAATISQPRLGLAPPAHIDGVMPRPGDDDDDDDALFESWHRDGGARAPADEVAACLDFVEAAPSRYPEPAPLAWVPSSWTTAIDKAVMNANGCIQLSGNRLVDIPSLVSDLANLRAFEPRSSPFSRIQSSPAAAFNLRRSPGRTSSGTFGPAPFSPSASPTAVPIELHLGNNGITVEAISNSLWTLSNLHVLSLRQNRLDSLPEGIGRLASLHTLNVASNRLKFLPAEILNLDNLAILNLHPNPWFIPPSGLASAAPAVAPTSDSDEPVNAAPPPRRRRRVLGPVTVHFTVPSLEEVCIRQLLEPIGPSAELAQPLIKHFYTADYLREVLPPRLNDVFLSIFPHANPASSAPFVRARHFSTLAALSSSPPASSSQGSSSTAPFDPLSHVCRSPAHAGHARVFYRPAVERFEWVSEASLKPAAAAQQPTKRSSDVRNIPIRWRGCGPTCLDWLEAHGEEEVQTESTE